jgi:hypothetical protein
VEARKSEIAAAPHYAPDRVKPASSGAKNVWDLLPPKGSAALLNKMATQHAQRLASGEHDSSWGSSCIVAAAALLQVAKQAEGCYSIQHIQQTCTCMNSAQIDGS